MIDGGNGDGVLNLGMPGEPETLEAFLNAEWAHYQDGRGISGIRRFVALWSMNGGSCELRLWPKIKEDPSHPHGRIGLTPVEICEFRFLYGIVLGMLRATAFKERPVLDRMVKEEIERIRVTPVTARPRIVVP